MHVFRIWEEARVHRENPRGEHADSPQKASDCRSWISCSPAVWLFRFSSPVAVLSAGGVSVWRLPGEEQRHRLRRTDQHPEGQPGTNQNQDSHFFNWSFITSPLSPRVLFQNKACVIKCTAEHHPSSELQCSRCVCLSLNVWKMWKMDVATEATSCAPSF